MNFANEKEVFEFIKTAEQASEPMRTQLGQRRGMDGCYYEEIQWLAQGRGGFNIGRNGDGTIQRWSLDYGPEARKLRVVDNDTTALVQKSAASTNPSAIYVDGTPPERDTGPDAAFRTRVHEVAANAAIDDARYLAAAQLANFRRCIFGTQLIGLAIENGPDGRYVCAFEDDPTCLITDPYCQALELHAHPHVTYTNCWPLERIKAIFGIEIKPEDAKTLEQLDGQKTEWNALSQNKLFTRHARYQKSKGARFYQLHVKDGRRFGQWFVVVEDGNGKKILVNQNDIDTPFGGMGMPLVLLHGYTRADTMWSWGEVAQVMNDQNQKNLNATQSARIDQNYTHARPVVDRRWFDDPSDDAISSRFTNQIGAPIIGKGSDRQRNAQPPTMLQSPPPPPHLANKSQELSATMVRKTHKAPGNFGVLQTHIPDASLERSLEDAGQVDAVRLDADFKAHLYLVGVLHATTVKLVKERNPPTAAMLRVDHGFDGQDFAALLQADPNQPGVTFTIQSASYRTRSPQARKRELDGAAKLQMLTPEDYQLSLAELGLPLTEESRQAYDQAQRWSLKIIYGQEWEPKPLGDWSKLFIKVFTRAQFARPTEQNPGALQRLVGAIQSIYQMWYQEQLLANPEMAAKAATAGGGTPGEQPQSEESAEPQAANVADVLALLSQGGPAAVGGQTAPAA